MGPGRVAGRVTVGLFLVAQGRGFPLGVKVTWGPTRRIHELGAELAYREEAAV